MMHRSGRRIAWTAGAVALAAAAAAQPGAGPAIVRLERAEFRPIVEELTLTGSVTAPREALVKSEVGAEVVEILAEEGDVVTAGAPLARLRAEVARIEVRRAEADLAEARARLRELEAGARAEDLAEAKAKADEARASSDFAQAELARYRTLLERQAVSDQEFESRSAAAAEARARYEALQAAYERMRNGAREEEIAASRARVAALEAELALRRDRLERHTIRAPFDGVVTDRLINEGQWSDMGAPAFRVTQLDSVRVEVAVPERFFSRALPGTEATVTVSAMGGAEIPATVTRRVARADEASRSFPVLIDLPNSDGALVPGMVARVRFRFPDPSGQTAILVPKDAVTLSAAGASVWVAANGEGGMTANPVPVQVGRSMGSLIQISGGLEEGAQVVTRGNERLRPGAPIVDEKDAPAPGGPPQGRRPNGSRG